MESGFIARPTFLGPFWYGFICSRHGDSVVQCGPSSPGLSLPLLNSVLWAGTLRVLVVRSISFVSCGEHFLHLEVL